MLSDMWDMVHIGDAMAIFSLMYVVAKSFLVSSADAVLTASSRPIAGPALAPMCAGFMYVSGVDWR